MKKIIFFVLSTVFVLIIPNVVNAADVYSISANNVDLTGSNSTLYFDGYSSSYTFSVNVVDYSIHNYYILYASLGNASTLNASLSGGCGTSCFGSGVFVQQIALQNNTYPVFAIVLSKGKTDCGVGSGACLISNNLTLSSSNNFYLNIIGAVAQDENPLLTNNYQNFNTIINAQNQNTQDIIGNNNYNTNNIINNQNQNANQAHQDSENIQNAITNEDIPTDNSSTAQSWASNNASDSVVSDMVLMPITLLNAFYSGFNGSCQSYNLGSLYGTDLTLPCINIQNYLGATLWGIIDVLMSGFLIYGIGKKFVKVFNDFTNLKDSQVDELYGGGSE